MTHRATTEEVQADINAHINEVLQLRKAAGSHISELLGHYRQQITTTVNGREETRMYDVFVTAQNEFNLSKFLTDGPEYTTAHLFSLIMQLLEGIKHMKDKNVTHNDIKPRNIFLNIEENPNDQYGDPLLSYFGWSTLSKNLNMKSHMNTPK